MSLWKSPGFLFQPNPHDCPLAQPLKTIVTEQTFYNSCSDTAVQGGVVCTSGYSTDFDPSYGLGLHLSISEYVKQLFPGSVKEDNWFETNTWQPPRIKADSHQLHIWI